MSEKKKQFFSNVIVLNFHLQEGNKWLVLIEGPIQMNV